jgi:hypothetical protein
MGLGLPYMIARFVLALVAVLVRGDVSKEAELLVPVMRTLCCAAKSGVLAPL